MKMVELEKEYIKELAGLLKTLSKFYDDAHHNIVTEDYRAAEQHFKAARQVEQSIQMLLTGGRR